MRSNSLSADSTGFETSHLDDFNAYVEDDNVEPELAPHLKRAEEYKEEEFDEGPVPTRPEKVHIYPDPYVRGQYDNVTWQR